MKYTNKMVLVPQDALQQINTQSTASKSGLAKVIEEYENELQRILNDKRFSPEEQYSTYTQLFKRYLKLEEENRQPATVVFKQDADLDSSTQEQQASNDSKPKWLNSKMLQGVPKAKRSQATLLAQYINDMSSVKINQQGEVTINGNLVPGSHILDLIHDFSRERRRGQPAVGADLLAVALKQENVPREFIGNPDRMKLITLPIKPTTPASYQSVASSSSKKAAVFPNITAKSLRKLQRSKEFFSAEDSDEETPVQGKGGKEKTVQYPPKKKIRFSPW